MTPVLALLPVLMTLQGFVWGLLSAIVFMVTLLLIGIILIQDSKDTGLTSAFGGGGTSNALLGARMQKDLAKITAVFAAILAVCLTGMALITTSTGRESFGTTGTTVPPPPAPTPSSSEVPGGIPGFPDLPPIGGTPGGLPGTGSPVPGGAGLPGSTGIVPTGPGPTGSTAPAPGGGPPAPTTGAALPPTPSATPPAPVAPLSTPSPAPSPSPAPAPAPGGTTTTPPAASSTTPSGTNVTPPPVK